MNKLEYPKWISAEEQLPDDLNFVGIFGNNFPVIPRCGVLEIKTEDKTYLFDAESIGQFEEVFDTESMLIPNNALKWWFPFKQMEEVSE